MRASPFCTLALGKRSLLASTVCDGKVSTIPLLEAAQPRVQALAVLVASSGRQPCTHTHGLTWHTLSLWGASVMLQPMPGTVPSYRITSGTKHQNRGTTLTSWKDCVAVVLEDHVLSSLPWEHVCRQLGTSLPLGHPQVPPTQTLIWGHKWALWTDVQAWPVTKDRPLLIIS